MHSWPASQVVCVWGGGCLGPSVWDCSVPAVKGMELSIGASFQYKDCGALSLSEKEDPTPPPVIFGLEVSHLGL